MIQSLRYTSTIALRPLHFYSPAAGHFKGQFFVPRIHLQVFGQIKRIDLYENVRRGSSEQKLTKVVFINLLIISHPPVDSHWLIMEAPCLPPGGQLSSFAILCASLAI
jgi:hypothetical protein